MRVWIIGALALGLWGAASVGAGASQAEAPPITKERLSGTWEGLAGDELRVFVVTVAESGTTAAMGIGIGDGIQDILTFTISKTTVDNGSVRWEGVSQNPQQKYRIEIHGLGRESQGRGEITSDWRLLGPKGDVKATWSVRLVGRDGAHIERIAKFATVVRLVSEAIGDV